MTFQVNDLRANLNLGGARPTLFDVQMTIPALNQAGAPVKLSFTCQAASMPASTIGTINVPYFGRMIPYPGDRTFSAWQVGILNDEDFMVRDAMENWHTIINSRQANVRGTASDAPDNVMGTAIVTQYDRQKNPLRQYTFQHIWPSNITEIDLNWASQDQIESFSVVFQYAWFDVAGKTVVANAS